MNRKGRDQKLDTRAKARAQTEAAFAKARDDFGVYAGLMHPRFQMARHSRMIVEQLERVERGEIDRLMLFLPPRHGKSLLASQLYPSWYLGKHPDRSVIATSYGQELASDFGREVRRFVTDPSHRKIFPGCVVRDDSNAVHRFGLTQGGRYFATGSGGPVTGRGANLFLIDDAVKSDVAAASATERKSLQSWYENVAYTRLESGGAIVVIMTRWHESDLAGWLLREHAAENWTVVSLPAVAEPGDALGRAEGEPLWPTRFGVERLARTREAIGGAAWCALYQQRPSAATGNIFRREWWRHHTPATLPPHFEEIVLSLDTAYSVKASADYSVGLVLGIGELGFFVLDLWRERCEFPELQRAVEMLHLKWKPNRILVEEKGSGMSLVQQLQTNSRLPIFPVKVDRDKVSRASAVTPLIEAGKVFLPADAEWLADFVDETASFPNAAHDDQVDALTQALNYAREYAATPGMTAYYMTLNKMHSAGVNAKHPYQADIDNMFEIYDEENRKIRAMRKGAYQRCYCNGLLGPTKVSTSDGKYAHPECARVQAQQAGPPPSKWKVLA